jgi:pimeloyl-ACP methyl ester carboxylesterase
MEPHRLRHRILAAIAAASATLALAAPPALAADEAAATAPRLYDVRGAKLYVETAGAGAPIVFLHGGVHHFDNSFGPQREYFAAFRRVVGVDQRGHGHSPDDDRPFSYREMADDTAALIALLGLGPADVVGHSDGANVALLLARYHPEAVRRVVVASANLRGLPLAEWQRRSQWSPQQVRDKVQQLSDSLPPGFRADYQRVTPDGPGHWWTHLTKSYQLWTTPVVIEPAELKAIAAPVLVLAGDRDFTPVEATVEIYRGLPRGQLMIVPATGHALFTERSAQMNLAIRAFLEQPDADPPAR